MSPQSSALIFNLVSPFPLTSPETTIALAIVHQLIGLVPDETVQQLLYVILEALTTQDFDYWGEVKDEVMSLVGQYINEHNMNQVKVYQKDLATLIDRSAQFFFSFETKYGYHCIVVIFL